MKVFCAFFVVQFLYYGLLTWNYRAVASARIGSVFTSDLACAAVNFTLIKRVSKTDSKAAMAGYVLGGAFGSVASVLLTKRLYGA